MDDRRDELHYRRINQLTAVLIASGLVLVTLVGTVGILRYGRAHRAEQPVSESASTQDRHPGQLQRRVSPTAEAADRSHDGLAEIRSGRPEFTRQGGSVPTLQTQPSPANALVDELAALSPNDPEAADLLAKLEEFASRGDLLDAAVSTQVARAYSARGDDQSALAWARRALTSRPHNVDMLCLAAETCLRLGQLADALAYAERACELNGAAGSAHLLLATIAQSAGDTPAAVRALQVAKQDPSTAAEASLRLARIALDAGDPATAGAELDYCQSVRPGLPEATRLRAQWALQTRDYATCIGAATSLIDAGEADTSTRFALGQALLHTNRPKEAASQFARLAELLPDDAAVWRLWGTSLLRLLEPQEAAAQLQRAVQLDPRMTIAWQHLGVALVNAGDCPAALEAFDRALALDAALAEAHFGRAVCLARQGDVEPASQALQQAIALDAEYAQSARQLPGLAAFQDGRAQKEEPDSGASR